ncbi:MAG: putative bifunctional diguanylate cyclase/phosphodiesterase [Acidimicrobiales bacterium]
MGPAAVISDDVGGTSERRLHALMAIAEALAKGSDAAEVLQSVVDSARYLLDAESARLELVQPPIDGAEPTRRLVAVSGWTRLPVGAVRKADEGVAGFVVATGRSVRAMKLSEGLVDPPEAHGTNSPYLHNESGVAVPLRSQGEVLGTLAVLHSLPFRFGPPDVELMEQFALLATMAVDAGRRLEREKVEAVRLRALYLATEQVGEGIALVGSDGRIRYANPAYGALHGLAYHDLSGRPVEELMAAESPWSDTTARLAVADDVRSDAWIWHHSGTPVEVELHARTVADHESGAPVGTIVMMHRITDRKAVEAELHRQARSDALTGLANRRSIIDAVTAALGDPKRCQPLALVFVDLDRFKKVNDGLGHRIGDLVLVEVARRFASCLGDGEVLGRLGGDEFVVLLEATPDAQAALAVAARLAATLHEPITVDQRGLTVTASIGVTLAEKGSSVEVLLRDADAAMYQAKAAGRDTQVLLDRQAAPSLLGELELEEELRRAIAEDQLRLAFQPVVDLSSGRVEGFEAQVRWAHPVRGMLLPSEFMPIAEESSLARHIGGWILRRGAELMAGYLPRLPHVALGVNISSRQLAGNQFVDELDEILGESRLPPDHLILEVTESLAMSPSFEQTLHHLRERKVRLAIDDLGAGYSNLAYLKRLPVSILKIDRSFVSELGVDDRNRAIVATLLDLGASFGMDVVADGIESPEQLGILRQLRCPFGQGKLLGPAGELPAPAELVPVIALPDQA